MHACFIVEIGPAARKMQPFTRFWRKLSAVSLQMAIFRRLNSHFTKFYTQNVVRAIASVDETHSALKIQSFFDLIEN